jgi:hypothetical protein
MVSTAVGFERRQAVPVGVGHAAGPCTGADAG